MKEKYLIAGGVAVVGAAAAAYFFMRKKKQQPAAQPLKESERHHLTNAFARAKQVAVGR